MRTVLFKKNNWVLSQYKDEPNIRNCYCIENNKIGYVDYPIIYPNMQVAYDFPYRIPNYIKILVTKALIKQKESE